MKLLLEEAFKSAEQKATLKKEFKIASSFDHPNIIQVYGHRQTRKHAYFIMEHFGGPNLKQIIRGDLTVIHVRFRKLVECLLLAMSHIHEKGWLHRDIKPDNIMMTKASDVRLIDFSLSSKVPSAVAKLLGGKTKTIQGTRTYIAPEIVRRKLPSVQSDLYSFGVTLYECLTGRPPFMGSTPNDLLMKHIQEPPPAPTAYWDNISPEMEKFVLNLLSKKPENRPASASDVLSEFRSLKIFNRDPEEYARERAEKERENLEVSVASKLDSRSDAERQQRIREGLEPEQEKAAPVTPPPQPKPVQAAPKTPPAAAPPKPVQKPATAPPAAQRPAVPPAAQKPKPASPPAAGQPPRPAAQAPPRPAPVQRPQPAPQRKPTPPPVKQQPNPAQADADDLPFADELPDIF